MKQWTIYCHIHIESGRKYIGLTSQTWQKRWKNHVNAAKKSKDSYHFPNAIRKYGKDAFSHEVLGVFDSLEEANAAEIEEIAKYDTTNPEKGFNLAKGGLHTPHPIDTSYLEDPEFHEKASERSKLMWQDPNYRSTVLKSTQDALKSPEIKEKMNTPEYKQRMSEISKQAWQDPEYLAKHEEIWSSPEFIEKARSRWNDPEFREKCSSGFRNQNASQKSMTHCKRGHERTPENIVIDSKGGRNCRVCNNMRSKLNRTHCPRGHLYSSNNINRVGRRLCDICRFSISGLSKKAYSYTAEESTNIKFGHLRLRDHQIISSGSHRKVTWVCDCGRECKKEIRRVMGGISIDCRDHSHGIICPTEIKKL